jgi:hypothetical protein
MYRGFILQQRSRTSQFFCSLICSLLITMVAAEGWAAGAELRLANFRVDVTPPIGDGPCVGCMPRVASIEHPLEMRGVVLQFGDDIYVISAIDFCGICNTSDEVLRDAMAKAAGTSRERVALQSLHQHSAPILDADAVGILHGEGSPELAKHIQFTNEIAQRTAIAIQSSLSEMKAVTRVVGTKAIVEHVGSNRRVPQPDGSIAVRASVTREPAVRDAPEGLIDPWLRTVSFFCGDQTLVQLHYYATHPQTFYGDARISWDCVGMARQQLENESGVPQIYFTGCGGNITVGKYNDGTRAAREQLTSRLHNAMVRSSAAKPDVAVDVANLKPTDVAWATAPIRFTVREDGAFNPGLLQSQLAPEQAFSTRLTAAMFSGFGQRLRDGYISRASRLRIGELEILHLPGEPFVEFQLYAQEQAAKSSFVCVAGYGECGVWYYGPDRIFTDRGGYEQTWSLTGPCEAEVKSAITALLTK